MKSKCIKLQQSLNEEMLIKCLKWNVEMDIKGLKYLADKEV